MHQFVRTASERLEGNELGDISWLEHGLRESSQRMCREILKWLLRLPRLRVPGDASELPSSPDATKSSAVPSPPFQNQHSAEIPSCTLWPSSPQLILDILCGTSYGSLLRN